MWYNADNNQTKEKREKKRKRKMKNEKTYMVTDGSSNGSTSFKSLFNKEQAISFLRDAYGEEVADEFAAALCDKTEYKKIFDSDSILAVKYVPEDEVEAAKAEVKAFETESEEKLKEVLGDSYDEIQTKLDRFFEKLEKDKSQEN